MTHRENTASSDVSIVIAISERHDDIAQVFGAYEKALDDAGFVAQFFYVLDGEFPSASVALNKLIAEGKPIKVIQLARWFGEATALSVGFNACNSDTILTLPPYLQIEPSEVPKLVHALRSCDMAVASRQRSGDTNFNRIQSSLFNWTVRALTGESFHDLGCGVRAMRRQVIEELQLYGDQHRFISLLASHRGFRVVEIECQQANTDKQSRLYGPGIYLRRMLDALTAFFLVKFTKKPLRFFGMVGSTVFASGFLLMLVLAIQRLAFDVPLGDRPLLLLAALLVVLGVQVIAIGLIGEIIIFTHAKEVKEYNIERIVRGATEVDAGDDAPADATKLTAETGP